MSDIFEKIGEYGIVPLVTLDDPNDAVPLARALVEGGIPVAEVTLKSATDSEVLKRMAQEVPEIIVGAGSVHNIEQAQEAVESGAKFVSTLGLNAQVVDWCVKNNVAICLGVATPSDIEAAMSYGLTTLKFFPAEASGGIKTLQTFAGAFSSIKFIPTGGVAPHNFTDYLDLPNVAAISDHFVLPAKLVEEKDWAGVNKMCKQLLDKVFDFTVGHVGINAETTENASKVTQGFQDLFNTDRRETGLAFFSGNLVEVMKVPFVGTHGHICVDTRNLPRAMAMLKRKGVEFDESKFFYDAKGNLMTAYLKEEIGGFALHIRQHPPKK